MNVSFTEKSCRGKRRVPASSAMGQREIPCGLAICEIAFRGTVSIAAASRGGSKYPIVTIVVTNPPGYSTSRIPYINKSEGLLALLCTAV